MAPNPSTRKGRLFSRCAQTVETDGRMPDGRILFWPLLDRRNRSRADIASLQACFEALRSGAQAHLIRKAPDTQAVFDCPWKTSSGCLHRWRDRGYLAPSLQTLTALVACARVSDLLQDDGSTWQRSTGSPGRASHCCNLRRRSHRRRVRQALHRLLISSRASSLMGAIVAAQVYSEIQFAPPTVCLQLWQALGALYLPGSWRFQKPGDV